jgi:hypothetical protein
MLMMRTDCTGAVDQGTSSTRFLVFVAETGQLVTYHQLPIQVKYLLHHSFFQKSEPIFSLCDPDSHPLW